MWEGLYTYFATFSLTDTWVWEGLQTFATFSFTDTWVWDGLVFDEFSEMHVCVGGSRLFATFSLTDTWVWDG